MVDWLWEELGQGARCPKCYSSFWVIAVDLWHVRFSCFVWDDLRGRCCLQAHFHHYNNAGQDNSGRKDIDWTPEAPCHRDLPCLPLFSLQLCLLSDCKWQQTPPAHPVSRFVLRYGTSFYADALNEGSTCKTQCQEKVSKFVIIVCAKREYVLAVICCYTFMQASKWVTVNFYQEVECLNVLYMKTTCFL